MENDSLKFKMSAFGVFALKFFTFCIVILIFDFYILHSVANASVANISSTPKNLLTGLSAWWTFDGKNVTASTVLDSSGAGKTGTFVNFGSIPKAQAIGKSGQALTFPGAGYFSYSIALTNSHSYSFWINPTDGGQTDYGTIFTNSTEASGLFFLKSERKLNLFFSSTDNLNNTALPLNKWTHVAVVSSAGSATFYVNGVEDGTVSSNPSITITRTGNAPLNEEEFVGKLDDIRVYSRALSAAEVKQLYNLGSAKVNTSQNPAGSLSSGLSAWWTFDGKDVVSTNVADSSGLGANGTLTNWGSIPNTKTIGKIGQGLDFNASPTNKYVRVNSDVLGTGQVSVSVWIKPNLLNSGFRPILINSVNQGLSVSSSNNTVRFTNNGIAGCVAASNVLTFGKWTHAVVSRGADTNITFYINGVLSGTPSQACGTPTAGTISIIGNNGALTLPLIGAVDDLRVYNRVLSAVEIKQLYNLGSAKVNTSQKGLASGLVGWWTFDGKNLENNVADSSGLGNNGYMYSVGVDAFGKATSTAVVAGKLGQALKFSGVRDVIVTTSDFIGTSALTISAWIKPTGNPAGAPRVVDNTKTLFYWGPTSSTINFKSDGVTSAITSVNGSVPLNKWTYVSVTRDAAGLASLYVNGVLSGAANRANGTPVAGSTVAIGGVSGGPTSNPFKGSMDDVRIYSRALSATEILQLYNMGR